MRKLIFRQITEYAEFELALRLRYSTYLRAFPKLIRGNWHVEMEADEFDHKSVHFGIFDQKELIGYTRLIFESDSMLPKSLPSLSSESKNLIDEVVEMNNVPVFELSRYYANDLVNKHEEKKVYLSWLKERSDENSSVVEVSRLILASNYRSIGIANSLVALIFSFFPAFGLEFGVFQCNKLQKKFYQRFGIRPFETEINYNHKIWGQRSFMYGHYKTISKAYENEILNFAYQLANNHRVEIITKKR